MSSTRGESPDSLPFPNNDSEGRAEVDDDTSDEDTEEASETDLGRNDEYNEIGEEVYQDKLANLKKQLQQLKDGNHPEYNKKNKLLEAEYRGRLHLNSVAKTYMEDRVERDYVNEMKAAAKEYEEKRTEVRESLIAEWDEKLRTLEKVALVEQDSNETKPAITRKLRRRPNDPPPVVEKRRKPAQWQLSYLLDERDVESDLKAIARARNSVHSTAIHTLTHSNSPSVNNSSASRRMGMPSSIGSPPPSSQLDSTLEPRIEDGKLRYEKRFFHRGQPVYVIGKDLPRFAGNIHNIGSDVIWVKKVSDSSKVRIYLSQLSKKRVHIERRVP